MSEPGLILSLAPSQIGMDPTNQIAQNGELIDKFASLFSPATPPATPLSSSPSHPASLRARLPTGSRRGDVPSSPESEFGAFVSVNSSEDPLSLTFSPFPSPILSPRPRAHADSFGGMGAQNASLTFFGKFTADAKLASELKRKDYLEELLLHEDDPLYWVADDADAHTSSDDRSLQDMENAEVKDETTASGQHQDAQTDGGDPIVSNPSTWTEDPSRMDESEESTVKEQETGWAGSAAGLPSTDFSSLAPSAPAPVPISDTPDPSLDSILPPPSHDALPDYKTLSTFSARWMSSLISSTKPVTPSSSLSTHNALETVFSPPAPAAADLQAISKHRHVEPRPDSSTSAAIVIPKVPHSRYIHSQPVPAQIYHGTPFSSSHSTFIPPSGAPGYAGENHAWDRGFSDDENPKRWGLVLKGRQEGEGCVRILDTRLANLIRPHLPALSRLPDTWTLLYSLDQHGISLNTLYSRCENRRTKAIVNDGSWAALLVIKDTGDTVFGAWLGDGIRPSKGAYYGSGESFLWRFHDQQLEVYKWTGMNDYIALCETEFISFGGGDGHYGLYLDDSLIDGSSAHCPTFDNRPLCSPGPKKGGTVTFECVGLEVWGVG